MDGFINGWCIGIFAVSFIFTVTISLWFSFTVAMETQFGAALVIIIITGCLNWSGNGILNWDGDWDWDWDWYLWDWVHVPEFVGFN